MSMRSKRMVIEFYDQATKENIPDWNSYEVSSRKEAVAILRQAGIPAEKLEQLLKKA